MHKFMLRVSELRMLCPPPQDTSYQGHDRMYPPIIGPADPEKESDESDDEPEPEQPEPEPEPERTPLPLGVKKLFVRGLPFRDTDVTVPVWTGKPFENSMLVFLKTQLFYPAVHARVSAGWWCSAVQCRVARGRCSGTCPQLSWQWTVGSGYGWAVTEGA